MALAIGQPAPDFTLPSDRGEISLSAYRGKTNVLLAFYPADFSPLCTNEMMCFAQDWSEFRELGCEILGISTDSVDKHQDFSKRLQLAFPLLSDTNKTVVRQYGVDSVLGTRRAYFIIDKGGILRYTFVEFLPITKRENQELLTALRGIR